MIQPPCLTVAYVSASSEEVKEWEAATEELRNRLKKSIWKVTKEVVESRLSPAFVSQAIREAARETSSLSFKVPEWATARDIVHDRVFEMFAGVFMPGVLESM